MKHNPRLVSRYWQEQHEAPADLVELLILAESLAEQGDDAALDYISQLRNWCDHEADAVLAQYLCHKGQVKEGLALYEKVFKAWQTDPWCPPELVTTSIDTAKSVAIGQPEAIQAARLYNALKVPFAVRIANQERQQALFDLATHLYDTGVYSYARDLLAAFEPHFPWSKPFLELRAECYTRFDLPLAAAARQDLAEFDRYEGHAFALAPIPSASPDKKQIPVGQPTPEVIHARELAKPAEADQHISP